MEKFVRFEIRKDFFLVGLACLIVLALWGLVEMNRFLEKYGEENLAVGFYRVDTEGYHAPATRTQWEIYNEETKNKIGAYYVDIEKRNGRW